MRRLMLLTALAIVALPLGPARAERCPSPETYHAPQPVLAKEALVIVGANGKQHVFQVEMALTPEQQEIGLMARKSVPADGGMLFDMGNPPEQARFWMCNTVASLTWCSSGPTARSTRSSRTPSRSASTASQQGAGARHPGAGGRHRRAGRHPCG